MNAELIEQNVHRLLGAMTGAATTAMVAVGDQLGLYRALADGGPATQDELAARTGTAARYLREWLSQQAAAGFLAYREGDGRYVLPAEAAAVLAQEASPAFLAGGATITRGWFAGIDRLAEAFRTGAGIPWHEQDPAVFEGTERFFRPGYAASLTTEWVPALPGVADSSPPAAASPTSDADTAWPPSCWPAPTRRRASTAMTSTTAPSRLPGSGRTRPASAAGSGSSRSTRPATRPTAST
jgi:hypothetical protein